MSNYFERRSGRFGHDFQTGRNFVAEHPPKPRTSLKFNQAGEVIATHETGNARCLTCARQGVRLSRVARGNVHATFVDVEALGPPGIGDIFAIGAVHLNWLAGGIMERRQWNIAIPRYPGSDGPTLKWAMSQRPEVQAQLTDPNAKPFAEVWDEIMAFLVHPAHIPNERWDAEKRAARARGESRAVVYADDWSDFAWLDFAAREAGLPTLRSCAIQADSSILNIASGIKLRRPARLIEHVAVDDAEFGALELMTASRFLSDPKGSGDLNLRYLQPVQPATDWAIYQAAGEAGVPMEDRRYLRYGQ